MRLGIFDSSAGKQSCRKDGQGICEAEEQIVENVEAVHRFDSVQNTQASRRADIKRCDHHPVKYQLCLLQQHGG